MRRLPTTDTDHIVYGIIGKEVVQLVGPPLYFALFETNSFCASKTVGFNATAV